MESFELRPSNQYILVRVILHCFRFAFGLVPGECPLQVQPKIPTSSTRSFTLVTCPVGTYVFVWMHYLLFIIS